MTEVKKFTKIVLVVYIIIFLIMGTMITFLYDITLNLEGWTNPYYHRFFGGIIYVSAIFAFLMIRKKEWEEIKMLFWYFIGITISTLVIEGSLDAILSSTLQPATLLSSLTTTIPIMTVILIIGIITLIKQRS
jgi:hypothetical protein